MPRPKTFSPDAALVEAMRAFWDLGYAGASIDILINRLRIRRQSLYDTFTDKSALFLSALELYDREHLAIERQALRSGGRPMDGLLKLAAGWSLAASANRGRGCLLTLSLSELAGVEPMLHERTRTLNDGLESAIRFRMDEAAEAGDMHPDTDTGALAAFLVTARHGMMVQSRAAASPDSIRAVSTELNRRLREAVGVS